MGPQVPYFAPASICALNRKAAGANPSGFPLFAASCLDLPVTARPCRSAPHDGRIGPRQASS
jgi:hypothetical protein